MAAILTTNQKEVLAFRNPRQAGLPVPTIIHLSYLPRRTSFLCYPNNYNHYVNYYRNTFSAWRREFGGDDRAGDQDAE